MQKLLEKLPKINIRHKAPKDLPQTPGIYVFFKSLKPIYIGKAVNLKRRILSYFDLELEPKTARMIAEADFVSYIRVTNELEALLLEARLIREYMPRYNIVAKDDKHPLYIAITDENFPRVLAVRKLTANSYNLKASFGPFPSSSSVHSVLRMLRGIFPYSDHKIGTRKCFYSQIGLCNPCPSEISKIKDQKVKMDLQKNYRKNITRVNLVLSGKFAGVKNDLQREMNILSDLQNYEASRLIRDQIEKLDYITRPQLPSDFYMQNPNLYEDTIAKEMSELKKLLHFYHLPFTKLNRIECFDVAHLAGTNPVASMITFIKGEPTKEYYRHFKIKKAKGGNDYDSMSEVATRRANHFDDWGKPDLIIVDGGKGQISAFKINVPVVGIAKNPDRLIIGGNKIKLTGAALNLVSHIRDEAHRFARRYHHHLISKEYKNAGNI